MVNQDPHEAKAEDTDRGKREPSRMRLPRFIDNADIALGDVVKRVTHTGTTTVPRMRAACRGSQPLTHLSGRSTQAVIGKSLIVAARFRGEASRRAIYQTERGRSDGREYPTRRSTEIMEDGEKLPQKSNGTMSNGLNQVEKPGVRNLHHMYMRWVRHRPALPGGREGIRSGGNRTGGNRRSHRSTGPAHRAFRAADRI